MLCYDINLSFLITQFKVVNWFAYNFDHLIFHFISLFFLIHLLFLPPFLRLSLSVSLFVYPLPLSTSSSGWCTISKAATDRDGDKLMTLHSMYRHQREKLPLSCLHGFVEKKKNKRTKKKNANAKLRCEWMYRTLRFTRFFFLSLPEFQYSSSRVSTKNYFNLYPIYKSLKFFVLFIFLTFSFVIFFLLLLSWTKLSWIIKFHLQCWTRRFLNFRY